MNKDLMTVLSDAIATLSNDAHYAMASELLAAKASIQELTVSLEKFLAIGRAGELGRAA